MTAPAFGFESTTDQVLEGVHLHGKRILVTGTSAGLGVETARALASHGARVIGAVRDLDKAQRATEVVRKQAAHGGGFELVQLDLSSLASVRACADALVKAGNPLDVIITNAGVMACPLSRTKEGFERQFGTNHLGHFVLVNRLLPLLRSGARLVNLSSAGHRFADVDLDDPNFDKTPYKEFVAYGRSKTANVLFAVEFDRRHRAQGIRAAAVHPGGIQTELGRDMTDEARNELMRMLGLDPTKTTLNAATSFRWKTIPQGAATSVWTAVVANAESIGGRYCEDCHVADVVSGDSIGRGGVRSYAVDAAHARALWSKSEQMVGEQFG